jgi:hypothetical protein
MTQRKETRTAQRDKKIAHAAAGGEAPVTYKEQDKNSTVKDSIRDNNQRSAYVGRKGVVQSN